MLTATAEHALRAMLELGRLEPKDSILGRDLAERAGVPPNYLSKILVALNRAGFVAAVRGSGGGYQLTRPANQIRLVDVVAVFDPNSAHPRCLLDVNSECSDATACSAHDRWKSVRSAYVLFLQETTLADVSES